MPMLYEIKSDAFKANGVIREPIKFHRGLNTILGGSEANNSIGKSTFLLVIDYCFGGSSYTKNQIISHVGDHVVYFTFDFGYKMAYFARKTSDPNHVMICDKNYEITETIPIKEFTNMLKNEYYPNYTHCSFRELTGRYFRIAGKHNDNIENVLNNSSEKNEKAIEALEKLFGLYDHVYELKEEIKELQGKSKAIVDAKKFNIIPVAVKNDKQLDNNLSEIRRLEDEKENLTNITNEQLLTKELGNNAEAAEISVRIASLKRQHRRISSQWRAARKSIEDGYSVSDGDIEKLKQFFPDAQTKKIQEIESFHKQLKGILTQELQQEVESLESLKVTIANSIEEQEKLLFEKQGVRTHIPKTFLKKYSEYDSQISVLQSQNQAYRMGKEAKDNLTVLNGELSVSEENILVEIESSINSQLTRFNDLLYNERRIAPALKLKNGKSYEYITPKDDGTGTAFKSLIILDLAIMELTDLPAIAHDSSLFKNIGDEPIEGIMKLYKNFNTDKQIFIALDKAQSYSDVTREILESTEVIHLDEHGNQLYGENFAKNDNKKAE